MKCSFITWLPHCRRSDSLASLVGGKSHLIHYLGFKKPWQAAIKYPLQALQTLSRLSQDKPDLVLVASPPVVAVLPVYLYARIRNIPFVIDAHTGVFDDPRWAWLLPLSRWLSRAAIATVVTNEHLARIVNSWGAQAVVLGSLPVSFPAANDPIYGDEIKVVVTNTFSNDEPVEAVVKAAKNVPHIKVYITGDLKRAPRRLREAAPPNVHFTDWISDQEYAALLRGATVVMVLTTRDHTMQRGAYEAMALERPVITSNWPLLRQTFNRGTIHVDNTVPAITNGIETAVRDHELLASEMKTLRQERNAEFDGMLKTLLAIVKRHPHFSVRAGDEKKVAEV